MAENKNPKHGEVRDQYLTSVPPETIQVLHKEYPDQVITINKHQFDKAIHKRCNKDGALVSENGNVIPAAAPAPATAGATK